MSISISGEPFPELPEPVARIADVMATFPAPWALCGGWAIDAWLGRVTRDHADVDIAVLLNDQRIFFEHLSGWDLVAHDPRVPDDTAERWDGRPLVLPAHIHARPSMPHRDLPKRLDADVETGFWLDVQINECSGDDWVVNSEPHLAVPLSRWRQPSRWGLRAQAPEVILFMKAGQKAGRPRHHDAQDFAAMITLLSDDQRHWLREAISLVHPGHAWLSQLRQ